MTRRTSAVANRRSWQLGLAGVGVVALALSFLATGYSNAHFYRGWLVGFLFCWEATMGCLGMLMLHHLTGGNWGCAARPAFAAGAALLPLIALAFLPIALNLELIFPWIGEGAVHDTLLAPKAVYLNAEAYWTRAAVYFAVWLLTWLWLGRARSLLRGHSPAPRRNALGLILLVLSMSFAAIDWGMSLEPHWFSAIYGAIYVAGAAVTAMAVAIVAVATLRIRARVPGIAAKKIRRDLGSLLLAMLMVWTYFVFSQYLLIWSGNLPEETVWYLTRGQHGWQVVAIAIAILHFFAPFLCLLSQDVRKHPRALPAVAGLVLAAHALHLVWLIAPAFYTRLLDVPWTVVATLVGMACLWSAAWLWLLARNQSY